jgi:hypothetical protein
MLNTSIKQIIGISWINFLIYRVLLLQREPYCITNKIGIIQCIIILGVLLINVIELYSIVKVIFNWTKVGRIAGYVHKVINAIYWKPLATVEVEIMKIPGIGKVLIGIGKSLLHMLRGKKAVISLLMLYTIMPRTIMGISLCIDIIYFNKMAILYKVLFIVVYTLTFNVIIGLVKHHCTVKKEELETESLIVNLESDNPVIGSRVIGIRQEEFNAHIESWLLYHNILDVILALELAKQYWLIIGVRIINVIMYIIAWCWYISLIIAKPMQ